MAKKRSDIVTNLLAILMLLEIAAVAGLGGYFILTGKVSPDQIRLGYKVYQGEITDQVIADAESWQAHQAAEAQKEQDKTSGADAKQKLDAAGRRAEAERLGLLRLLADVEDREKLVRKLMEELNLHREALVEQEKRIDIKLALHDATGGQASFQEKINIMKKLKPKEIKDVLLLWDEYKAVEALKALGDRLASKVLGEFTTPSEIDIKQRWLDLIGSGEVAGPSVSKNE